MHDLGNRDGEAVCGDVTKALRKQITDAVVRANPEVAGRSCGEIMTLILRSLPSDQLDQFTTAKIENTKVTGKNGTFVYRLHDIRVDGKVTRDGGPVEGLLLRPRAGVTAAAPWPRAEALTTPRLVLEPLRPEHARELAPVLDDPALHAFTGGEPARRGRAARALRPAGRGQSPDGAQGWLNWVARDRATHAPVGTVQATISDDAGVRTAALGVGRGHEPPGRGPRDRGRARAARTGCAITGVTRFVAHIHPDHAASAAVARHLGLARDAIAPTSGGRVVARGLGS